MYKKNDKESVKLFVKKLRNFVEIRMVDCEFKINEYFDPTNQIHLNRLSKVYNTNFDIKADFGKYVFARFVSSWQNGTGKGFIIEESMGEEIKNLLCDFNLNKVIKKYGTANCLPIFNELQSNKDRYIHLYNIRRMTDKMNFCEGMYTLVRLLHFYKSEGLLVHNNNVSISRYLNNESNEKLSEKVGTVDYVVGMSWTLLADAIKESGLLDIGKPDIHVVKIMNSCFGENIEIPNSKRKSEYFQSTFKNIADLAEISVYELDKLFWLGATANYYLEKKSKSIKGLRDQLIEYLNEV